MSDENNSEKLEQNSSINIEEQNPLENINNSKELEKKFLEGEIHKEITDNQLDQNITENNNIKEENTTTTKSNYLENKISKMKINKNILHGINKSMDKQMKNLETDIFENKILMTEIPKNLNKILSRSLQKINPNSNYDKKIKMKAIRDLQEEKDVLKIKLQKIISNEKFLDNEGFMQKGDNVNSNNFSPIDQKLYENKKKLINEKKNKYIDKIDQIEEQLKQLITNGEESSRKERIKNYIENFEKDKEIIESRAKKYYKEAKERNQRMANDLNKKAEKRKKEIDEKCKEEELKKAELLKKLKEQEKATVEKRTKINDEKTNMFKPFLKKIPKENVKDYLFVKKYEEYQKEEQNLIDKENIRRKEKMRMDLNEINEFEKNVINNREKFETENAERKKKLILEWKERKELLPTYISRKQELVQEELKKDIENEENKKERNIVLNQKKYSFGYDIKNNKQPEINAKLKKKRTDIIKSLEDPKTAVKEQLFMKRQKKAEELLEKKNDIINNENNKNNKKKIKIKLNNSINKLNDSINLIQKKKIFYPKSPVFPLHPKPETKIDYLAELRNEKEKQNVKRNAFSSEKNDNNEQIKLNSIKWDKAITCEKGTLIENVNYVKERAKIIDNDIKKKQKILDLYGGVKNNPEIGEKISNMLIDSIEAKLSILNKFKEE